MGLQPLDKRIILEKTERSFENQAVLNPAVYQEGEITHIWYRAVHTGNYSSIGYAQMHNDEIVFRAKEPFLKPQHAYESHGLEDPRVVCIDGVYYMFYNAYDGEDVQVAYATTDRLPNFRKRRIISPHVSFQELRRRCEVIDVSEPMAFFCLTHLPEDGPNDGTLLWEKDVFLFPRRIHGKLALIHRIKPDIQLVYCKQLTDLSKEYWVEHLENLEGAVVLGRKFDFENGYLGGGAPPIETPEGWLMIYHAVEVQDGRRTYRAGLALLDLDNPEKETHRLPYPLFSPEEEWEKKGDVNDVVFPSGAVIRGDIIEIYYGAADSRIGRIRYNFSEMMRELLKYPVK